MNAYKEHVEMCRKLIEKYTSQINHNLKKVIKIIIDENDQENKKVLINQIKEIYKLTDTKLEEYILIVKTEILYSNIINNLNVLIELLSENNILFVDVEDEFLELNDMRQELEKNLKKIEKILSNKANPIKENSANQNNSELFSVSNFVIFLDTIEEERSRTMDAKSGKEKNVMLSILKEITLMMRSNYELLRRNGKIHQINDTDRTQLVVTKYNLAYERIGSATTKISYVRIPICEENIRILSKKYNNNIWKYIMIIVSFGNFQNEGISERKLYDEFRRKIFKNIDEIERIIKIFNEPFNNETFDMACNMIEQGLITIQSLTEEPYESLSKRKTNVL